MDFRAPIGTPVFSVLPGTVKVAATTSGDAGKMIVIEHDLGLMSRYMHLSKILVDQGDVVAAGEQIAASGDTGAKGRPHLHFDLLLPGIQLPTWTAIFGRPDAGFPGFRGSKVLFKVPVEPLVPIDSGHSHVFREAKLLGIRVRQDDAVKSLLPVAAVSTLGPETLAMGGVTLAGSVAGGLVGRWYGRPGWGAAIGLGVGALGGFLIARHIDESTDAGLV